jgi:hypothetical protein
MLIKRYKGYAFKRSQGIVASYFRLGLASQTHTCSSLDTYLFVQKFEKTKLRFMYSVQQHLKNIYDEHQLQIKHFFLRLRTLKCRVCVKNDR